MVIVGPVIGLPACAAGVIVGVGAFNVWSAAVVGVTLTAVFARWVYNYHRTARLVRKLLAPETRATARADLERELQAALRGDVLSRDASIAIVGASSTLLDQGEHAFVAEWMGKVDLSLLREDRQIIAANNEAIAWLGFADVHAARAAFNKIGKAPEDPISKAVIQSTEATILSLEGAYQRTLEIVAELAQTPYGVELEHTTLEAEATAYAGLRQIDRAEECLRALAANHGTPMLTRVITRGGPAAPIARKILVSAPYR